jgi:hypothetical protein
MEASDSFITGVFTPANGVRYFLVRRSLVSGLWRRQEKTKEERSGEESKGGRGEGKGREEKRSLCPLLGSDPCCSSLVTVMTELLLGIEYLPQTQSRAL